MKTFKNLVDFAIIDRMQLMFTGEISSEQQL